MLSRNTAFARRLLGFLLLAVLTTAAVPHPAAAHPLGQRAGQPSSCLLVTQAEVAEIMGGAAAEGREYADSNQCAYRSVEEYQWGVELGVEWGGGSLEPGLQLAGPGFADGVEGLGDAAWRIGGTLFVLQGENLLTLSVATSSELEAKGRALATLALSRM